MQSRDHFPYALGFYAEAQCLFFAALHHAVFTSGSVMSADQYASWIAYYSAALMMQEQSELDFRRWVATLPDASNEETQTGPEAA